MFTFGIITCNRLHYFKNCITSILEFVDTSKISIIVVDNHTTEKGFDEFICTLPKIVKIKKFHKNPSNSLYRAMNYIIKYSRKMGDSYVNFIQDDSQYVSPLDLDQVVKTFEANKKIQQVQTQFFWRKSRITLKKREINGHSFYLLNKGIYDNGFMKVSLYDQLGLYPVKKLNNFGSRSGEQWLSKKTKKRRMLRACTIHPNLVKMNAPICRNGKLISGKYSPPKGKYYVKIIPEKQDKIKELIKKGEIIYGDDFIDLN